MHKLWWFTLALPSLFLLATLSEADAKPSFPKGNGSCSVAEYWSASSQGSCSYILPSPEPFSVGKGELEVRLNNAVSARSCYNTKTGAVLVMMLSGPDTHNTISETEDWTATLHPISDTADKLRVKSLVPEAESNGNITTFLSFNCWVGVASKSRLNISVTLIEPTKQAATTHAVNKLEYHRDFPLSTTNQEYNYHRKTGRGYIPLPYNGFPVKLTLGT